MTSMYPFGKVNTNDYNCVVTFEYLNLTVDE